MLGASIKGARQPAPRLRNGGRAAATNLGSWSLLMAKRSATSQQAQLSSAVIKAAQKAGASRVDIDPASGRIVVILGNGGPNSDGIDPPETPDELRKLL